MPDADPVDRIAEAVERALLHLVLVDKMPPDLVLSAALVQVGAIIAATHGGADAASVLRAMADRVERLPAHADHPLAAMPAAGRA